MPAGDGYESWAAAHRAAPGFRPLRTRSDRFRKLSARRRFASSCASASVRPSVSAH
ncbi:hypothetical protein ACFPRL_06040 [Pseudoclavibacter helvolus]